VSVLLPKSVEFMNMLYCDLPFYKAEGKATSNRQDDMQLWRYNIKDCISELRISYELELEASRQGKQDICDRVHRMWPVALEMQRLGLIMNEDEYDFAKQLIRETLNVVGEKRKQITGDINIRSNPQMTSFLYGSEAIHAGIVGLGLPEKKKKGKAKATADEKALVELMMRHPDVADKLKILNSDIQSLMLYLHNCISSCLLDVALPSAL